jgi:release factor glutamine methyltransferase
MACARGVGTAPADVADAVAGGHAQWPDAVPGARRGGAGSLPACSDGGSPAGDAAAVRPAMAVDGAIADVVAGMVADMVADADRLVALSLAWPPARVLAWGEVEVPPEAAARLDALLARRGRGEPFAYLCGTRAFHSLTLAVTPAVLVPRPETELLVEGALAALPATPLTVADCGTGSGAVALALAAARPGWRAIAIDDCAAALAVAAANAASHRLDVQCLCADWTRALPDAHLDALVANPPYLAADDPHLPTLVHEPAHALVAGADGLDAIRALLADAPRALRAGGYVALEHGAGQGAAVRELLAARGFDRITTHRDLAGHERVTSAWRR